MELVEQEYELVAVDALKPHPRNANHGNVEAIAESIDENRFYGVVLVQRSSNTIIAGEHRWRAAIAKDAAKVPVLWLDVDDERAMKIRIADNAYAAMGVNDERVLLENLQAMDNLLGTGYDNDDVAALLARVNAMDTTAADKAEQEQARLTLAQRFLVPPFSVLDARQGYWQDRKRAWLALGIQSEVGRGDNLLNFSDTLRQPDPAKRHGSTPTDPSIVGYLKTGNKQASPEVYEQRKAEERQRQENHVAGGLLMQSDSGNDPAYYYKKRQVEEALGRELTTEEFQREYYEGPDSYSSGTSIFDPVLCELAYRWFCPAGGRVLDPFAGGSVRGIVAASIGYDYTGIDLSEEQIKANLAQAGDILSEERAGKAMWVLGDSSEMPELLPDSDPFDLVFTCPPYFDLERYSDDPRDLSNKSWDEFLQTFGAILQRSAELLAEDRFVVLVIGEVRARSGPGNYRGLVPSTIWLAEKAGLSLYNEAVLVTAVGSVGIRAGRQFASSRKLGKTHQNVLVFAKGDGRKAAEACGLIEVGDPAAAYGEVIGGVVAVPGERLGAWDAGDDYLGEG